MAPHSSTLAWKIPRTEEPGMQEAMGLQRVGHNLGTEQQKDIYILSYTDDMLCCLCLNDNTLQMLS